jgi:hypothetical protein
MPDLGALFGPFFSAVATLALLFIVIGWVSSKLVELGQAFFNSHGRMLHSELKRCFGERSRGAFTRYFYWHPLIEPLSQPATLSRVWSYLPPSLRPGEPPEGFPPGKLPAYIAPETFAAVMLNPLPWPTTPPALRHMLVRNLKGVPEADDDGAEASPAPADEAPSGALGQLPRRLATERQFSSSHANWGDLIGRADAQMVDEFDQLFLQSPVSVHGRGPVPTDHLELLRNIWCHNNLFPPGLRTRLIALLEDAEGDIDRLRASLSRWYGEMMDRVTGRFKRTALAWVFVTALGLCLLLNVDAIRIYEQAFANAQASDDRAPGEPKRGGEAELAARFQKATKSCQAPETGTSRCAVFLLEGLWRDPNVPSFIGSVAATQGTSDPDPNFQRELRYVRNWCQSEKRTDLCGPPLLSSIESCIAEAKGVKSDVCTDAWDSVWRHPTFFWDPAAAGEVGRRLLNEKARATSAEDLMENPAVKEAMKAAEAKKGPPDPSLRLGFHLPETWDDAKGWNQAKAILGLFLAALLAALGAPFWYDLLGRISSRGTTGPKP